MSGPWYVRGARGVASSALISAIALGSVDSTFANAKPGAELVGIAHLPADTFVPGPVSGQFIDPEGNQKLADILPFKLGQPLQGISSVFAERDGTFLVLADNGYGSKKNSADFVLTVYRIRPRFRTAEGGDGSVAIESAIQLRDPFKRSGFTRVADLAQYPPGESGVPVDPAIKQSALLTGVDFDPESLQKLSDGSYWIGDEFGPWLLHFDVVGRLLEAPVSLPGLSSPDNVMQGAAEHCVASSGGFEGLALDAERRMLYAMLEKPLTGETHLQVHAFDLASGKFSDRAPLRYPLEEGARGVGAFESLGNGKFLTVERDSGQGTQARIKRVYSFDENVVDENGLVRKMLVADLLHIRDPLGLAGEAGSDYAFSFQTIESLAILDAEHILLINDNNYPFGNGPGDAQVDVPDDGIIIPPEDTVLIVLKVPNLKSLPSTP